MPPVKTHTSLRRQLPSPPQRGGAGGGEPGVRSAGHPWQPSSSPAGDGPEGQGSSQNSCPHLSATVPGAPTLPRLHYLRSHPREGCPLCLTYPPPPHQGAPPPLAPTSSVGTSRGRPLRRIDPVAHAPHAWHATPLSAHGEGPGVRTQTPPHNGVCPADWAAEEREAWCILGNAWQIGLHPSFDLLAQTGANWCMPVGLPFRPPP
jgi:hypothetical protein